MLARLNSIPLKGNIASPPETPNRDMIAEVHAEQVEDMAPPTNPVMVKAMLLGVLADVSPCVADFLFLPAFNL